MIFIRTKLHKLNFPKFAVFLVISNKQHEFLMKVLLGLKSEDYCKTTIRLGHN